MPVCDVLLVSSSTPTGPQPFAYLPLAGILRGTLRTSIIGATTSTAFDGRKILAANVGVARNSILARSTHIPVVTPAITAPINRIKFFRIRCVK